MRAVVSSAWTASSLSRETGHTARSPLKNRKAISHAPTTTFAAPGRSELRRSKGPRRSFTLTTGPHEVTLAGRANGPARPPTTPLLEIALRDFEFDETRPFKCSAFAATLLLTVATQASVPLDRTKRKPVFVTLPSRGPRRLCSRRRRPPPYRNEPVFRLATNVALRRKYVLVSDRRYQSENNKVITTIKYLPIMLRIHFADGTVLDPTKPGCNDAVSVEQRFFGSPLFHSTPLRSNGVAVGDTQVIDPFDRVQFRRYVKGATTVFSSVRQRNLGSAMSMLRSGRSPTTPAA